MDKKLFKMILTICLVSIAFAFILWNFTVFYDFFIKALRILRPVFFGFFIAFILMRPYDFFNNLFLKAKFGKKHPKIFAGISLLIVYVLLLLIITGIVWIVIPQFVTSIVNFSSNINSYFDNIKNSTNDVINYLNEKIPDDINLVEKIQGYISQIPEILQTVFLGAFGVTSSIISVIIDIFIGFMISMYFLIGKEKLKLQLRKVFFALFKEKTAENISSTLSLISQTFSNYIAGQIIEAFVLGTLSFIGMTIFGFEYPLLISVFLGVTSLIPVIGPYIGTIPSAFILLLISPLKAFWFIIFVIGLQQIESNIFYPRVVGTKVGLPAIWVLVAVLVGGGLFGIVGILIAVPTMSVIYDLSRKRIYDTLDKKKISVK